MHPTAKFGWTAMLACASLALAQEMAAPRGPSVSLMPVPVTAIPQGKAGNVNLHFRVVPGFHINSNTPNSEFLIPTALKLSAPTDIVVGRVSYPPGDDMSFSFAPDEKLSVYTRDFNLTVVVRPLHNVLPSKYMLRGELRYQACDNAACYPPKKLPVQFEVKVVKGTFASGKKNPAQSPHVHR